MREILILGCDGNVGAATLTLALARTLSPLILLDCDVDGPSLAERLPGRDADERHGFFADKLPTINFGRCDSCGLCAGSCHRDAVMMIGAYPDIDLNACDSCQVCGLVCPTGAIAFRPREFGAWFRRETATGSLLFAWRDVCLENGGQLAARIRREGARLARASEHELILTRGPAGVHYHLRALLDGLACAVLVATPEQRCARNLKVLIGLCLENGVPPVVLINRGDMDPDQAARLETLGREAGAALVDRLPDIPALRPASADSTPSDPADRPELMRALTGFRDRLTGLISS